MGPHRPGLVVPTSTHMKALSSAAYAASKAGKAAADAAKQVDDKYGVKDKIKGRTATAKAKVLAVPAAERRKLGQ